MKWRIKRDFEKGILWGGNNMYGYRLVNKKYEVILEQAEVVKRIFKMYLDGYGVQIIAHLLNNEGLRTTKNLKWNKSTVLSIITNYNYTGGLILQKTYREDYLSKRKIMNKGEKDMYVIDDNHEPIISMEDYMIAQKIRQQRQEMFNIRGHGGARTKFTSLIKCGICGANFERKNRNKSKIWICFTYNAFGKNQCLSKGIPEETLDNLTAQVLGVKEVNEDIVKEKIEYIEAFNGNKVVYHFKNGNTQDVYWQDRSRRESWTPEMREQARMRAIIQHRKEK